MDKKWIGLIIILIAGLSAMAYIVYTSNTVGNAVTVVDDITITLPPGFKILGTHNDDATLVDENNKNATIYVKYISDGNTSSSEFKKRLKSINNNGELELIKKSDETLQYKNITSGDKTTMQFVEKYDRTLYVKLNGFDNDNELEKNLKFVVDNIKPDYKQNRA